jgi:nanoRNase/pAp phosphatase (c-di-AMP/oligoRNAs hydrolase)
MSQKFRLVTRSDFDGLVCGALLTELGMIDEIAFVHPKDMQDGKIPIGPRDITTNLPYVAGAHLSFDHHDSETMRVEGKPQNHIIIPEAPSAARVVYDYYGGRSAFPGVSLDMMVAVDKADSAQFTKDEILNPSGWNLLNYLMDSRTGLGRFRNFRISNYALMMDLIGYCKTHGDDIGSILAQPDVQERVDLFFEHEAQAKDQIIRCSRVHGNCVVLDLRGEETIFAVNRFMIYAMHLGQNVSIHAMWGLKQQNTVFAVGKSIIDRSCKSHIGAMMLQYGGGGHEAAGTCQIENARSEEVLAELVERLVDAG